MNLSMLLDIPASIVPDDVVLVDEHGQRTYGDLAQAAAKVAALLTELGVDPGDRVGVLATNRVASIEILFGTAAYGAAVVPMNFRAKETELAHLLADSGAKVVFTEGRYLPLVRSVAPEGLGEVLVVDGPTYAARRDAAEAEDLAVVTAMSDVDDDDLAILLYTSGTTALPKGVVLTHGGLTGYVLGTTECADGTPHGRTLLAAPLHHVAGVTSTLSSIYSGRTTVLLPQFGAGAWLEAVERHGVTHAFVVPTMLARILEHPDLRERDLSSLELVTYGAAPMPPPVIRRALDAFPKTVGFSCAYGQTETTATVSVLTVEDHRIEGTVDEVEAKLRRLSSVGRPLDDVEIRVVDQSGVPVGPGVPGDVQLRTSRTMKGYWGDAGAGRTTVDDEGWVHTGDLGSLDEGGYLFLGGRSGGMIIRGGENIAPEEVEVILFEHPDVIDAAVVGLPDEEWGEIVGAAVVARPGSGLDEGTLRELCATHLAGGKRPEAFLFVDDLPRTVTGKLVRRDLVPLFEGS